MSDPFCYDPGIYDPGIYHPSAQERQEAAGVSIFAPDCPLITRTAVLWEMSFLAAETAFREHLAALCLPRPGSIITLARPALDENGDELPAELDVVSMECHEDGSILCSAEREDGEEVSVWLHPGEWYQRAGER